MTEQGNKGKRPTDFVKRDSIQGCLWSRVSEKYFKKWKISCHPAPNICKFQYYVSVVLVFTQMFEVRSSMFQPSHKMLCRKPANVECTPISSQTNDLNPNLTKQQHL